MKLATRGGLNCYLGCLVGAAAHLGVDYPQSFSELWSETDFLFDAKSRVFFTERLETAIKRLGVCIQKLACADVNAAAESVRGLPCGGLAVFGMDMHDVPWSPLFGEFNGPHYFAAIKEWEIFTCFDPTYGLSGMTLAPGYIAVHTYDIRLITLSAPQPFIHGLRAEAEGVLRILPALQERLFSDIALSEGEGRRKAFLTARYTDALINNRYFYKRYLSSISQDAGRLFDKDFFSRWEAVKNGLFKASVLKNNAAVLSEVRGLLCALLDREREIARKILSGTDLPAE